MNSTKNNHIVLTEKSNFGAIFKLLAGTALVVPAVAAAVVQYILMMFFTSGWWGPFLLLSLSTEVVKVWHLAKNSAKFDIIFLPNWQCLCNLCSKCYSRHQCSASQQVKNGVKIRFFIRRFWNSQCLRFLRPCRKRRVEKNKKQRCSINIHEILK